MKYFRFTLFPLLLGLLAASDTAFAAVNSHNVQVVVQGTVAGAACTAVGGPSLTVDLGSAGLAVLNTSNDAWVWQDFSLVLQHCPIGMTKATISFSGEPDPDNALFYKNIAVSSEGKLAADNVAIELMSQVETTKFLSNGTQIFTGVDAITHKAEFKLKARMITPTGRATAGAVNGHIDYTVEYQ